MYVCMYVCMSSEEAKAERTGKFPNFEIFINVIRAYIFTFVFVGFHCFEMIFCFSSFSLMYSLHACLQHSPLNAPM